MIFICLPCCTAGAIWTNTMPGKLAEYLPFLSEEQRAKLFGDIASVIALPRGNATREGVIHGSFSILLLTLPFTFSSFVFAPFHTALSHIGPQNECSCNAGSVRRHDEGDGHRRDRDQHRAHHHVVLHAELVPRRYAECRGRCGFDGRASVGGCGGCGRIRSHLMFQKGCGYRLDSVMHDYNSDVLYNVVRCS